MGKDLSYGVTPKDGFHIFASDVESYFNLSKYLEAGNDTVCIVGGGGNVNISLAILKLFSKYKPSVRVINAVSAGNILSLHQGAKIDSGVFFALHGFGFSGSNQAYQLGMLKQVKIELDESIKNNEIELNSNLFEAYFTAMAHLLSSVTKDFTESWAIMNPRDLSLVMPDGSIADLTSRPADKPTTDEPVPNEV